MQRLDNELPLDPGNIYDIDEKYPHPQLIKVVVDVVDEESDEEMRMFKEAMYGKKPPEGKNEEEDNEEKFDDLDDTDQQIAMVRVR